MLEKLIALFGLGMVSLTANSSQIVRLEVEQQADVYNVYVERVAHHDRMCLLQRLVWA